MEERKVVFVVPDPDAAGPDTWATFVDEYSDFILSCIRRFTSDPDEKMDMYAHVCSRLSADRCRRLRQFRGRGKTGSCKFTTWLATVTMNLCREWIRMSRGRRRLFKTFDELPSMHARIFKLRHWSGYSARQVFEIIRSAGEVSSVEEVERVVHEVEQRLTCDQRWRMLARGRRPAADPPDGEDIAALLPATSARAVPDLLDGRWAIGELRTAIGQLPPELRRVLRLRYLEGLTARETARVLEVAPYKRVYELQAQALKALREILLNAGVEIDCLQDSLLSGGSDER